MFKNFFGKKSATELEKAAYERGLKDGKAESKKEYDRGFALGKAKGSEEGYKEGYDEGLKDGGASKVDASPLTDKDKKSIKKIRAKLLNDLESLVKNTSAQNVRGASIIKEGHDIKLTEINGKDEALNLIKRAKDGEIKIIM
jgi:flagellar biosynthesis/type III secretory pathway protein FliH